MNDFMNAPISAIVSIGCECGNCCAGTDGALTAANLSAALSPEEWERWDVDAESPTRVHVWDFASGFDVAAYAPTREAAKLLYERSRHVTFALRARASRASIQRWSAALCGRPPAEGEPREALRSCGDAAGDAPDAGRSRTP